MKILNQVESVSTKLASGSVSSLSQIFWHKDGFVMCNCCNVGGLTSWWL